MNQEELMIERLKKEIYEYAFTEKENIKNEIDDSEILLQITEDFIESVNSPSVDNIYIFAGMAELFGDNYEAKKNFVYKNVCESLQMVNVSSIIKTKKYSWYRKKNKCSWSNYENYLIEKKKINKNDVFTIDDSTNKILNSIENPCSTNKISQKGLVVGDIQSGKTSNYIGLMAKMIDYEVDYIVILTGVSNELRNQTQKRIENDLIGKSVLKIVGIREKYPKYKSNAYMVTVAEKDLSKSQLRDLESESNNNTAIFVTKKNAATMETLFNSFNTLLDKNKSILVIDDEADYASIDTNANFEEKNETKINEYIRKILSIFDKNYYIAYTATPYANLFIDKEKHEKNLKEDLYPKDFVIKIPSSDCYTGYDKYFNNGYRDMIIEPLNENDDMLKEAVLYYFIVSSIKDIMYKSKNRYSDFNEKHSTMLVHTSHLTSEHQVDLRNIVEIFENLKTEILFVAKSDVHREIDNIFSKISSLYRCIKSRLFDIKKNEMYDNLKTLLIDDKFKILKINSSKDNQDKLDYSCEYKNYIVIGGNALSRGITLEGLVVSYFSRSSDNMDTLSQMGRWFGFRDKYLHLCRVYVTEKARDYFEKINDVDKCISEQIEDMCNCNESPKEFMMQIRKFGNFMPTSIVKQGSAKLTGFSFSSDSPQITGYNSSLYEKNKKLINDFSEKIDMPVKVNEGYIFKNIDVLLIKEFLIKYRNLNSDDIIYTKRTEIKNWIDYIENKNKNNELVNWTIVVKGKKEPDIKEEFLFGNLNLSNRNTVRIGKEDNIRRAKIISSPIDEAYDLELKGKEELPRRKYREFRKPENGLLVIYCTTHKKDTDDQKRYKGITLMVSFPKSPSESVETSEIFKN